MARVYVPKLRRMYKLGQRLRPSHDALTVGFLKKDDKGRVVGYAEDEPHVIWVARRNGSPFAHIEKWHSEYWTPVESSQAQAA